MPSAYWVRKAQQRRYVAKIVTMPRDGWSLSLIFSELEALREQRSQKPVPAPPESKPEAWKPRRFMDPVPMPLVVRKVVHETLRQYDATFEEVIGSSRLRRISRARWACIEAVAMAFPHRGNVWLSRFFGMHRSCMNDVRRRVRDHYGLERPRSEFTYREAA